MIFGPTDIDSAGLGNFGEGFGIIEDVWGTFLEVRTIDLLGFFVFR